nr:L447 [uncultured bacterium]
MVGDIGFDAPARKVAGRPHSIEHHLRSKRLRCSAFKRNDGPQHRRTASFKARKQGFSDVCNPTK